MEVVARQSRDRIARRMGDLGFFMGDFRTS
jgi:hypothetical protein